MIIKCDACVYKFLTSIFSPSQVLHLPEFSQKDCSYRLNLHPVRNTNALEPEARAEWMRFASARTAALHAKLIREPAAAPERRQRSYDEPRKGATRDRRIMGD